MARRERYPTKLEVIAALHLQANKDNHTVTTKLRYEDITGRKRREESPKPAVARADTAGMEEITKRMMKKGAEQHIAELLINKPEIFHSNPRWV